MFHVCVMYRGNYLSSDDSRAGTRRNITPIIFLVSHRPRPLTVAARRSAKRIKFPHPCPSMSPYPPITYLLFTFHA